MAEQMCGDLDAEDRFVRLDDGDMHIVQDGEPGAPAVLLIHSTGASAAWWDPVVPPLAAACRVIRVDLAGHGRSASPADGYDIPAQARRVGTTDDQRWRSSSAAAYRAVPGARIGLLPGVGHTPMMEDPQTTGTLLLDFAATAGHPS